MQWLTHWHWCCIAASLLLPCCCRQAYLEYLTAAGKWSTAADMLPQLLDHQGPLWERWLYVFAQVNQARHWLQHSDREMYMCHSASWRAPPTAPTSMGVFSHRHDVAVHTVI